MRLQITELSIGEIKERFLRDGQSVSAHLLKQLKRDTRHGVRRLHELLRRKYEKERTERLRLDGMLNFERVLWKSGVVHIAGVDEVGVGPLAGPVIAAAVVFPPGADLMGIDDSKRLEPEVREELTKKIRAAATGIGIGSADVGEIDQLNIYQGGLVAMRRAIEALPFTPQHVLVDSRTVPGLPIPQNSFHKGDGINFSIAAASIVAKTHRDALMVDLDRKYPGYGFAQHKGYATADHQDAIRRLGPCAIHRLSYAFIQELCGKFSLTFYQLKHKLEEAESESALKIVEQEFADRCTDLNENEQRKLRVMLSRRWKTI